MINLPIPPPLDKGGLGGVSRRLLYLLIFLLPLQTAWLVSEPLLNGFKWQYGTLAIYGTEILLWLILLLSIITWSKNKKLPFTGYALRLTRYALPIILLTLWSGLSIFWAPDRLLAFNWWLKLLEGIILFWLILRLHLAPTKIAGAVVAAGVVQAGLAVWQFIAQVVAPSKWLGVAAQLASDPTAFVVVTGPYRWLRAYGGLPHPNILGGFLAVALVLALALYLQYRPGGRKLAALAAALLIFAGLILSFSRASWLAALVALVLLLLFIRQRRPARELAKATGFLALIFVILLAVYGPLIETRLAVKQELEVKSVSQRLTSTAEAQAVIAANWLAGVGRGNYTLALYQNNPKLNAWEYQPVHNLYLLVWAELGIVGLAILLWLLAALAGPLVRARDYLGLSLLVLILTLGLFDHYLWTNLTGIYLFWLVLALVAGHRPEPSPTGWEAVAYQYSRLIGERGDFWRQAVTNPYLERALAGCLTVLDLGCGEGYLARVLASPGLEVVGVDASPRLIAEARRKGSPGRFIVGDITGQLPELGEFDAVVVNMVLMDVADIAGVYRNAARRLKSGGRLAVVILHPAFAPPAGRWTKTWPGKVLRRPPFMRVNNYGREFVVDNVIYGLNCSTPLYHRPLAAYVNEALAAGFTLVDLSEPLLSPADADRFGQPRFLTQVPVVAAMTFIKK